MRMYPLACFRFPTNRILCCVGSTWACGAGVGCLSHVAQEGHSQSIVFVMPVVIFACLNDCNNYGQRPAGHAHVEECTFNVLSVHVSTCVCTYVHVRVFRVCVCVHMSVACVRTWRVWQLGVGIDIAFCSLDAGCLLFLCWGWSNWRFLYLCNSVRIWGYVCYCFLVPSS